MPIGFLSGIQNHKVCSFDTHTVTFTFMIILGSSVYIYVYVLSLIAPASLEGTLAILRAPPRRQKGLWNSMSQWVNMLPSMTPLNAQTCAQIGSTSHFTYSLECGVSSPPASSHPTLGLQAGQNPHCSCAHPSLRRFHGMFSPTPAAVQLLRKSPCAPLASPFTFCSCLFSILCCISGRDSLAWHLIICSLQLCFFSPRDNLASLSLRFINCQMITQVTPV